MRESRLTAVVDRALATQTPANKRPLRFLGVLREQPAGLYVVSITEFWERFSYFGMLGLLVLFLTAPTATGGFGWSTREALSLYAVYTGAVFSAPAVGGYFASRYIGERRSILWGGVAVTAGHLLLAGPAVLPWLIEASTGYPVADWLRSCGIPLGQILPRPEIRAALDAGLCTRSPDGSPQVAAAYAMQAWSFTLGLVLIVAGTGFIKATVSSIVGKLYPAEDRRREEGFAIFMGFIFLGSLLSNFVAGTLGELLGWHVGFAAAGIGMAGGLAWYLARHRRTLGTIGEAPDRVHGVAVISGAPPTREVERGRVVVALFMSVFVIVYAMAFYQKGGLLNLEARQHVDRHVLGFQVPATWLLSVSTAVFVLLTVPATRLWRALAARGREPDVVAKLAAGLAVLACSYAILLLGQAEKAGSASGTFSIWWIVAMYFGFALGDLLVWPAQIAAVNRLAPPRYAAFAIGSWYLTIGFGSWLTNIFGSLGARSGVGVVAVALMAVCLVAALLLAALRPWLLRLSRGALDGRATGHGQE